MMQSVDRMLTWRQSSPDLTMTGRTAQPGRRPWGDSRCTRFALSAKRSPYTARAASAALSASSSACGEAKAQHCKTNLQALLIGIWTRPKSRHILPMSIVGRKA